MVTLTGLLSSPGGGAWLVLRGALRGEALRGDAARGKAMAGAGREEDTVQHHQDLIPLFSEF